MIRIAAHDLRSPLGVITGFSEMVLENGNLPPRSEEQIRHVYRAGMRMQTLISDFLSLDRILHLDSRAAYHKLDLAVLVEAVFEDHRALAAERHFSLHLPRTRVRVRGDSPQIREAIANYITNAIKYTPAAGEITVRLSVTEQEAVFEVIDNGYGIPAEAQNDLFRPFFRVQSVETHAIDGTGLGLHLVKNIVERHNGRIVFESAYGQGSTFGFRLPLVNADTDELTPASAAG
jgi:signal transduction histidine kinase